MKAIIIEEDRFRDIREILEYEALKLINSFNPEHPDFKGVDKLLWDRTVKSIHRSMNYHFVKWAQSHGASCVK
jgi:hypothetical protein